ncbi:MFS transporter [Agrobacterium sp. B1(2019)]|nr:MFS transporter [Agrobacterium sp. B1(2019)]
MDAPQLLQIGTTEYRRLSVAMVMAGFSTFSLLYSVQPLLPEFANAFQLSPQNASLAVSLATGPMAVGILVASWVSDRFGRRTVLKYSLVFAALSGSLAALAPTWEILLVFRCIAGLALAGVPAVAMTYVAEEVTPSAISPALGLYIAGSAIGGMIGRLGASMAAEWLDWRWALAVMGLFSTTAAMIFCITAPHSRGFAPISRPLSGFIRVYGKVLADKVLLALYAFGFLTMGVFATVYNYAPFRLGASPYELSHSEIGMIFLLYIVGSVSSALFGKLAGRIGVRSTLVWPVLMLLVGLLLTAAAPLWLVILSIGVVTAGFFGAHTVASSWVTRRAFGNRGHASALYLFAYYAGSSVLGSVGGVIWDRSGWAGLVIATMTVGVAVLVLVVAISRSKPLEDPLKPRMGQELPG